MNFTDVQNALEPKSPAPRVPQRPRRVDLRYARDDFRARRRASGAPELLPAGAGTGAAVGGFRFRWLGKLLCSTTICTTVIRRRTVLDRHRIGRRDFFRALKRRMWSAHDYRTD